MAVLVPNTALADEVAAGGTSADFPTLLMDTTKQLGLALYIYCADVATWIAQGANPTASVGAGSMFVPASKQVVLDGKLGAKLAVIDNGSAGHASLAPALRVA